MRILVMNKLRTLILFMGILSFANSFASTSEEQFWKWFAKNEGTLFSFEKNRDKIFDKLSKQLAKVHPDLTFEFGPVQKNGKREFVISADGIKGAFPSVEAVFNAAPNLPRWQFIKYRPRRVPINDIKYGDKSIRAKDVHYGMYEDGEKIGIVLFFDNYNEKEKQVFSNIGYLFLDEALGEYDVETKIGFIEIQGRGSELFKDSLPLEVLASDFDEYVHGQTK
jgi:hypothetical protein